MSVLKLLLVDQKNDAALTLYHKMGYRPRLVLAEHGHQLCMAKHLYLPSAANLLSLAPQRPLHL